MQKVYKFKDYLNRPISVSSVFETNGVETDYSNEQKEITDNLSLDFSFINGNIPIEPFYLLSESLIKNLNIDGMTDDKGSVVYITLCALAILFEEPKEKYKKMFEELRLRGIYAVLKPIVNATKSLKGTFDELAELSGKNTKSFEDMFKYTELFTPFMMAVSKVITDNNISPDSLEITEGLRNSIILAMKELKLNGRFKETIDKINIDIQDNGDDIKKYSQFKDEVEMIQDDKSH